MLYGGGVFSQQPVGAKSKKKKSGALPPPPPPPAQAAIDPNQLACTICGAVATPEEIESLLLSAQTESERAYTAYQALHYDDSRVKYEKLLSDYEVGRSKLPSSNKSQPARKFLLHPKHQVRGVPVLLVRWWEARRW